MCTNIELLTQTLQVLNSLVDSTVILLSFQQSFLANDSSSNEPKPINDEDKDSPILKFNLKNLQLFPFKFNHAKVINKFRPPSNSMLDSLIIKLKDYLKPPSIRSLVLRNPMIISYNFRINLIEMYKIYNSIRKLINSFISMKTYPKRYKPKRLTTIKIPFKFSAIISLYDLVLVSEWFQQTTLVKFLKNQNSTTKTTKPKIKKMIKPKVPKNVDFNDFKTIQYHESNKDVKYYTFQLMEPTQIELNNEINTQKSLFEFNFERTQNSQSQFETNEPINEDELNSSISQEISSSQQEIETESIHFSPLSTPSPIKPVINETIYIDFKPVKFESPLLASMVINSTQIESQQQESSFIKKPAKRRIFMKHGLSKSQRIRKPLHIHYLKD